MTPAFDSKRLLDRVAGDRELLAEIAELFHDDVPRQVENLRTALLQGSAEGLADAAHAVKGATSNFCSERCQAVAQELEQIARSRELDSAPRLVRRLEQELSALQRDLRDFVGLDKGIGDDET